MPTTPDGARGTTINADAAAFFKELPEEVFPKELIELFPRIANEIYAKSVDREELDEYLSALMIDRRGGRTGFPPAVLFSLQKLKDVLVGKADAPNPFWD